jgi:DNA-nicking Smr family endonuclease
MTRYSEKKLKTLTSEEEMVWKNYSENISKIITKSMRTINGTKLDIKNRPSSKSIRKLTIDPSSENKSPLQVADNGVLLDKKIYYKLKNGRLKPSKTLDLHGLRYEDAKSKVNIFISSAYKDYHRLVLIITGKGKNPNITEGVFENERSGILRQSFPSWLENTTIKPLILNFTSAHLSHGGAGAFYVYLRKKKYHKT